MKGISSLLQRKFEKGIIMKKMFVAFGIAIAIFVAGFATTSVQAQAAEEPSVEEKLEVAFTEECAEWYPEDTIENVNLISVDKDYHYGNYKVCFTYDFNGAPSFCAVSVNTLNC